MATMVITVDILTAIIIPVSRVTTMGQDMDRVMDPITSLKDLLISR